MMRVNQRSWRGLRWHAVVVSGVLVGGSVPGAGAAIDTAVLEAAWPKQKTKTFEVGRHDVAWRQSITKDHGIRYSARFETPLSVAQTWPHTEGYAGLGTMTPGIRAVRRRTEGERRLVEVDATVLWKTITLTFEVEHDPPRAVRFRLLNTRLAQCVGVCLLREAPGGRTEVEMIAAVKPAVRVPLFLLALAERRMFLGGIRNFLDACDRDARTAAQAGLDNPHGHPYTARQFP